jgi:hypothetical protein
MSLNDYHSLVAKRYNRIEFRGFVGRPDSKEQADSHGDDNAEHRRP